MNERKKAWRAWRKLSGNTLVHDLLILIGAVKSPTFAIFCACYMTECEQIGNVLEGTADDNGFHFKARLSDDGVKYLKQIGAIEDEDV